MAKLPLNPEANAIRNITFSENKEKDHEIKQEMISILKEKTGYKKDEESSKAKRERREKIRDLAGDDPEKIGKLKEVLYDNDEEQKESDKYSEVGQGKEQKESKEMLTKSLEFEEETFKIDSKGWKEEKMGAYDIANMKVKVNATGDVIEYLKGPAKGEQIFITYDAFIREVMKAKNCSKEEVEQKYLMTVDELKEKMKDKPDGSDEYKKFFNKEVKDHLAGVWNPAQKLFFNIEKRSHVWLAGENYADFDADEWGRQDYNRFYGASGRLLKN